MRSAAFPSSRATPSIPNSTVLEKAGERSRGPDVGIVKVETIGTNQHGDIVISFKRTLLVYRKAQGPGDKHRPEPKRKA